MAETTDKRVNGPWWKDPGKVEGKRLFESEYYSDFYPIKLQKDQPVLDENVYSRAMSHFLEEKCDPLAVLDLVYLRQNHWRHTHDFLKYPDKATYDKLLGTYKLADYSSEEEDRELFSDYKRIVNDLGKTMHGGLYFEIALHNVRDPVHSILKIEPQPAISGRERFDPATPFVLRYIEHYGEYPDLNGDVGDDKYVRYKKEFHYEKPVKVAATTTPLHCERYGLIGIICINIDVKKVDGLDEHGRDRFFEKYVARPNPTPLFEQND